MTTSEDHFPRETTGLVETRATEWVDLSDDQQFDLRIAPVAKKIGATTVRMLAYNGSIPGPTLRVQQGTELLVQVTNEGDLEGTVHWHGLRLENRYDGTAETQRPIAVGSSFTYRISFPDPGVYWYHPHIREDYGQEMGLYGNIVVVPSKADYWPAVDREMTLTLDDILVEDGRIAQFNRAQTTYTAMGRFGNVLLANGQTDLSLDARPGEVVRFYLTNTANTRVFNVAIPGARMKLVGGDSGRYEREEFVERVLLAPSERAVVDVMFDRTGVVTIEHRTPDRTYSLAEVVIEGDSVMTASAQQFALLRNNPDMAAERQSVASRLRTAPEKTIAFVAEMDMGEAETPSDAPVSYICPMHPDVIAAESGRCPKCGMKLMQAPHAAGAAHHHEQGGDSQHHHHSPSPAPSAADSGGIEWEDQMVELNRRTTPGNMRWKIIDRTSGAEGRAMDWRFSVGERVKIRLVNEMDSDHPMHHPFHIHGAGRFLILSRDGVAEPNLVWKDTVLVPMGQTVDILLEVTNPGLWMAHCHIAEHHESGMMFSFNVE